MYTPSAVTVSLVTWRAEFEGAKVILDFPFKNKAFFVSCSTTVNVTAEGRETSFLIFAITFIAIGKPCGG